MKSTFPHLPGGAKNETTKLPSEPGRFFNFHVIVHLIDQLEWFGNLLLMSANRWETTHSIIKRLYRATRRATRTLASCMERAQNNSRRATWLVDNADPTHITVTNVGAAGNAEEANNEEQEQDSDEEEKEDDGQVAERTWTRISKARDVTYRRVVGDREAHKQATKAACSDLAEFTFHPDIAAQFWKSACPDMHKNYEPAGLLEEDDVNSPVTITVMESVSYLAYNDEERTFDKELVRCSKSYMGGPWQGGVQIIEPQKEAGKLRKCPVRTKSGLEIAYYPNFSRFFGLVQLIFSYQGRLWFLIERLEGAEKQRFGRAPWQNRIIPNWAYLRTKTNGASAASLKSRLEVFSLDDIERVRVITPDPNQPPAPAIRLYWCPIDNDCVPYHDVFDPEQKYELFGDLDSNGRPKTLFCDAINEQPWDLCPPPAVRGYSRDRFDAATTNIPVTVTQQPRVQAPTDNEASEDTPVPL